MHQKHLLRFIKSKLKKEPDEVVIFRWVCNAPVLLALIKRMCCVFWFQGAVAVGLRAL